VNDPRVRRREFPELRYYVRKTAWASAELQERQAHHKDIAPVRSLLADERVRRATQLSKALASDLSLRVGEQPSDRGTFFARSNPAKRLTYLFTSKKSE